MKAVLQKESTEALCSKVLLLHSACTARAIPKVARYMELLAGLAARSSMAQNFTSVAGRASLHWPAWLPLQRLGRIRFWMLPMF